MVRQCDYQMTYDPTLDEYVYRHVYDDSPKEGSGLFSSLGNNALKLVSKKAVSDLASLAAKKAVEKASSTTGEYLGKKAGDKIVKLLQGKPVKNSVIDKPMVVKKQANETKDEYDRNLVIQRLLAGSGIKRRR